MMNYPSRLLQSAVEELSKLPGIGEKTALRLAMFLLKQPVDRSNAIGNAIINLRNNIQYCSQCMNISETDSCIICQNTKRNREQICVVESIRELMAIENTGVFNGVYHVLGGVISPVEGIGPEQLTIDSLLKRIEEYKVKELIMALNPTIEGDTTLYYISKRVNSAEIKITSIARGVSFGGELEYTDELTLARSLTTRMPYENFLTHK